MYTCANKKIKQALGISNPFIIEETPLPLESQEQSSRMEGANKLMHSKIKIIKILVDYCLLSFLLIEMRVCCQVLK